MKKIDQARTIVSATIIMIVLGSLYTFGAIIPYLSSYLYYQGHETSASTLSIVYTLAVINMNVGMFIDSLLSKRLGNRQICAISIAILAGSIFITSFMNQLVGFIIFFGIFNGIGMGIGYMCPLKNAYSFFPNRKGFCAGFCMAGFGFGSVIFNQIIIYVINPHNAQINSETQRFPQEVANNVPLAFKILAACYCGLGFIGCLLMKEGTLSQQAEDKKNLIRQDNNAEKQQSILSEQKNIDSQTLNNNKKFNALRQFFSRQGIYLYLIIFTMLQFCSFIAFAFKEIGFALNPQFADKDHQLTIIGNIGILSNGFSRYIWGFLFDYLSFRVLITVLNTSILISIFTIQFTVMNIYLYSISVIVSFLCLGGMFSLLPTHTLRMYGPQLFAKLYWITFGGFTLASIIRYLCQVLIINNIQGKEGYLICIYSFGGLQIISLLTGLCVRFKYIQDQNNLKK